MIFFIREKKNHFGGAENYLSRLIKYLKNNNYHVDLINSPFPSFLPSWLRVILFNLYLYLIKKDKFFFSLERIVCADVYRAGDGVHKVYLQKIKKSKVNPLHLVYIFLEKKCFQNSKVIIANSEMVKKQIIETYSIKAEKIHVVYNGIELPNPKKIRVKKEFLEKNCINTNKRIFLFVGNGFERKGLKSFINIISNLNKEKVQAFVIGNDKNINIYKQISKSLGLESILFFMGERKDVNYFYSVADFVILPTKYDPFSNVILEAMSFKNIVITTTDNGAHEILNRKWVMKSYNDYSIIELINKTLNNEESIIKVKKENYQRAKQFSIEKNSMETIKYLKRLNV